MTKTRRIAAITAVLAGMFMAPAVASAATFGSRTEAAAPQTKFIGATQDGRAYAAWANGEINDAVSRIQSRAARFRMTVAQRQLLTNNTNQSANILRHRVAQVTADGKVTAAERHDVRNLAVALQSELRKAHGNLDSFWLL